MITPEQTSAASTPIRVLLADGEAIFCVGLVRIFAQEPDLVVVAQAENLGETLSAVQQHTADVLLFDSRLSLTPAAAISEILKRAPSLKIVVLMPEMTEQETVEFLRRGACGVATHTVRPELLVRCVRKVAQGEIWLSNEGVNWLIRAYTEQASQLNSPVPRVRLNEKEMLIISGVARGMKNKDIASEIGTTEQVVKNYLRKIYDKLGVADRLELALYCVQHRILDSIATQGPARPRTKAAAAAEDAGSSVVTPPGRN